MADIRPLDLLAALGSAIVDPRRAVVCPRLDATKPFSGRGETILKQNEHPMPQINKEAIMLQIILNAIYREFLKSGFPALASEERRR